MISVVALLAAAAAAQPAAPERAAPLPEATPLALEVQVTPEEVTLGQHLAVRVAVEHDARDVYTLPGFDPSPLAVPPGAAPPRMRREELPGRARTIFELTLVDLATLEPRLPDLTLRATGPQGERSLTIRGRALKFRSLVQEEGAPSPDQAHHGPKPPVPVMVRSLLWLWILAGTAALGGCFLFLHQFLKRKEPTKEKLLPSLEVDDEALVRLAALKAAAPWTRGEGRSAIFRLSEILRAYLGARLAFTALDLTSEEFLAELRHRRLIGLDLAELAEEVRWEDLVKFAKVEPTAQECLRGIARVESVVQKTRRLRSVEPGAAA